MTSGHSARLDIVPPWRRLNEMLVELVDHVPDERMGWSPKPGLWSFDRILLHVCDAREEWMTRAINDGEPNSGYLRHARTKDAIRQALRTSWMRIEPTITDEARLDATYRDRWWAEAPPRTGHWVAFHLLEHDIHHRADLLMYLALLGIETPQVWTP